MFSPVNRPSAMTGAPSVWELWNGRVFGRRSTGPDWHGGPTRGAVRWRVVSAEGGPGIEPRGSDLHAIYTARRGGVCATLAPFGAQTDRDRSQSPPGPGVRTLPVELTG